MADPFKQIELDRSKSDEAADRRVRYWAKELSDSMKREEKFRENAKRIIGIYEGNNKREENSFNILYANTETLLPACFNRLPRPFVDRRFKDADPVGKQGAEAVERVLTVLEDSGDAEYDSFYSLIEQATLGALVPGRGLTQFKYDPHIAGPQDAVDDGEEDEGEEGEGAGETGPGTDLLPAAQAPGTVTYETICGEDMPHDRVLFGYARRWVNCPWVAVSHEMTKEDVEATFGKQAVDLLQYSDQGKENDKLKKAKNNPTEDAANLEHASEPTATVWEIWNKPTRQVEFYAPSLKDGLLGKKPDPHGLSGFFPFPAPLQFLLKKSGMTPTAIYLLYEEQAKELNRVSMRINRVINACKVRGMFDGTMDGLSELLRADDNTMIKAKNTQAMRDGQNLQNSIWFMPLGDLVNVLQTLWNGREQTKNTIYEITGISDIMRGDTQASETFGAQKLKSQWGTQRLQRMQGYVQEYVRSCLRIMAEMAIKHFDQRTWAQMTDLPFATDVEIQQAQLQQQSIQQQMQSMPPPQPGPPGPDGQPTMPPNPLQPQIDAVNAVLAKPKWSDILAMLKDDYTRRARVDIETNSTIEANSAEDKQNMTEALTAIGTLVQQFEPMVQAQAIPLAAVKSILLSVARKFAFGREVEDALGQIPDQAPHPPGDPSVQAKQQAATAEAQFSMQQTQQKGQQLQAEGALVQQTIAMKQQQAANDAAEAQRKEERAQKEHELHLQEHALKLMEIEGKKQEVVAKLQATREIAGANIEQAGVKTQAAIVAAAQQKKAGDAKVAAAKSRPAGK